MLICWVTLYCIVLSLVNKKKTLLRGQQRLGKLVSNLQDDKQDDIDGSVSMKM